MTNGTDLLSQIGEPASPSNALPVEVVAAMGVPEPPFSYDAIDGGLADQLRRAAERIRARLRSSVSRVVEAGNLLRQAKERLQHGQFMAWVEREVGISPRSAARYMQLAEYATDKMDMVSNLEPGAAYALVAPSTPPEVRASVESDLSAGRAVSEQIIRDRIAEVKEASRSAVQKAKKLPARKRTDERIEAFRQEEARARAAEVGRIRRRQEDAERFVTLLHEKLSPEVLRDLFKHMDDYQMHRAVMDALRARVG